MFSEIILQCRGQENKNGQKEQDTYLVLLIDPFFESMTDVAISVIMLVRLQLGRHFSEIKKIEAQIEKTERLMMYKMYTLYTRFKTLWVKTYGRSLN